MSSHDPRVTLRQLADFIDEAEVLVAGRPLESLVTNPLRLRPFQRATELVGGCAKRLPAGRI